MKDIIYFLNQFADDADIASLYNQNSLDNIMWELENFRKHSGFTISYDKTTILRIGSLSAADASLYTKKPIAWTSDFIHVLGVNVSSDTEVVMGNYKSILPKITSTIQLWSQRNLSLFGKVNLINALIGSLFVYKMSVLPNISDNEIAKIEAELTSFLWNKKKPKVPLKILKASKENGGANLVDLRRRQDALKISWINILHNDPKSSHICYQIIAPHMKEDVWRVNIKPKDVSAIISRDRSAFWFDVLTAWAKLNYNDPYVLEDQVIWYNSNIKIGGSPVFWRNCYEKGLKWVSQLFVNGEWISQEKVKNQYGLQEMRFNSLKAALPKTWKNSANLLAATCKFDVLKNRKDIASYAYGQLENRPNLEHKFAKWEKIFQEENIDGIGSYYHCFKRLYAMTNHPKVRSFYYRLLHHSLVLNSHLYRWGMREDNNCSFCKSHKETVEHLLFQCDITTEFWHKVDRFIQNKFNAHLSLNMKDVIWCTQNDESKSIVNSINLMANQFLYASRCKGKLLNFYEFEANVVRICSIEKFIALKNNNITKHNAKWNIQ